MKIILESEVSVLKNEGIEEVLIDEGLCSFTHTHVIYIIIIIVYTSL